ncbi:hypothetical protein JK358_38055 [Nocardia sp. 2]|uniref:NB-ARC domain-containing protein n=1 Tax=Nocardia acididurans TaxID=2802282 RepID=A0ABS1MJJ0_9NOCA|nr:NB-ARC domain-containing protein [Nocardia acididurans]MBL1080215.1 hypothetical protein [Nocardia acididurans]
MAPPPGTFIDRTDLLDEVRRLAASERDGPAIITFTGLSGSGKTAFLRHCAVALRESFDIALSVDFAQLLHEGAVPMADVLAGLLGDLRVDERWIPVDLAGRHRRYLAVTEGRRVLLLLDGVSDAAQVLVLLPNSASALVVVAGEVDLDELTAEGAVPYRMSGLDEGYGAELLTRICADRLVVAEPEQIRRLVSLVDGSPRAIRVLAAQVRSRRGLSVQQLIAELEQELDGATAEGARTKVGDELTELFDAVYHRLSPAAARVYRLVGDLPAGRWSARAIAAACNTSVDKIEPLIRTLVDADLLAEVGDDEHLMPGLVRLHARRIAALDETAEDLNAGAVRAMTVVVQDAVAADRAVVSDRFRVGEPLAPSAGPSFDSARAAMAWFTQRHPELLGVARRASAQRARGLVSRLFQAAWPFYSNSPLYLQQWLEFADLAVTDAEAGGDSAMVARMLCQRARGHIENKDFTSAGGDLARAMELGRAVGGSLLASVLDFMGQFEYRQGHFAAALACFEEALALNEQLGDRRGIALQSQFRGRCLGRLDRGAEALVALDRADESIAPFNDARTSSRISYSRAEVLITLGKDAEAVASLHDSIDLAAGLGQTMLFARPLELLAEIAERLGDRDAECRYVEKVVALHRDSGSPELEQWVDRLARLTE